MDYTRLKSSLARCVFNLRGWRTNRKIVVIESDDWGSIRMPSREVYEHSLKAGYPVNRIAYERYDSLASEEDLELLFDLLGSFRDTNGNHPVFTANCVVANPDFEKIEAEDFSTYHYELITETFVTYPRHQNNFSVWKQGMKEGVFYPQYHGREHLNVSLFMDALSRGDRDAHFGFSNRMPGSIPCGAEVRGNHYVEALRYDSVKDKEEKLEIFLEGLDLFEKLFGYRSASIIPPNYIWSPDFDQPVFQKDVRYFQGIRKIREPLPAGKYKYRTVYLGKRNHLHQLHLVRNALFEPSMFRFGIDDPVRWCLSDMDIAFRMHKPAVISSHRMNYIGFLDEKNRDRTLRLFHQLLGKAMKRWPDIEFCTTDHLGSIIQSDQV